MSAIAEHVPGVLRPSIPWVADSSTPGRATWVATGFMATLLAIAALASGTADAYIAIPITLVLLIVFLVRPVIGFSIMVVIRPTLDEWSNTKIIPLTHSHPINAGSLMAGVLIVVGGAYALERASDIRKAPSIKPMILFGVLALISVPFSLGATLALTETLRYVSIGVMYALAYTLVRDRKTAAAIAAAILASAIIPTIVSIYQVLGSELHKGSNGFFRAPGTLVVVDAMGIFMALIITFGGAIALSRSTRWRWLLWVAAPFAFFALINSYGRTGWIGCGLGLIVIAASRHRWLLFVVPVVLAAIAFAVPSTTQRFADISNTGASNGPSNTLSGRISMWRDALPNLESRPVVGIGFGSDAIANGKRQVANDYVRALIETGIPGLVVYLWLLISALIASYWGMELARFGSDRFMRALALGSFAIVPVYMVVSITANMMTQVVVAGMFWTAVAIGHAYLKRDWEGLRP